MRIAVTAAVLLAVVATALVAVCQHSETRHLQYGVWKLERRHERLERTRLRLETAIEAARTPRRLLGTGPVDPDPEAVARLRDPAPAPAPGPLRPQILPAPAPAAPTTDVPVPAGFDPGDNFEGVDR